tara:strand:- start:11811 stop:12008 length:198 start_codon:yes stop_codon:yes gene_type:complete
MSKEYTFEIMEDLEKMGFSEQQVTEIINVFYNNRKEFAKMLNLFNEEHGIKESMKIVSADKITVN